MFPRGPAEAAPLCPRHGAEKRGEAEAAVLPLQRDLGVRRVEKRWGKQCLNHG